MECEHEWLEGSAGELQLLWCPKCQKLRDVEWEEREAAALEQKP